MPAQAEFFQALFAAEFRCPEGLRAWNGSDVAKRFAVYRNNVQASLIAAMADSYPVVRQLVGADFFDAMARVYVLQEPPCSPVLAAYGKSFPWFVERFVPAQALPYLADVARLEWARIVAFHAADAASLTPAAVGELLADHTTLAERRLGMHPSTTVLHSSYAIGALWAAHQGLTNIEDIDPYQAQSVLVLRPGLEVVLIALPRGNAVFIEQLLSGACLAAACLVAQAHADFDLIATLGLLIEQRALTGLEVGDDE